MPLLGLWFIEASQVVISWRDGKLEARSPEVADWEPPSVFEQETEGAFSASTEHTLPDRYIEGTCPHCGFTGARGEVKGSAKASLETLTAKASAQGSIEVGLIVTAKATVDIAEFATLEGEGNLFASLVGAPGLKMATVPTTRPSYSTTSTVAMARLPATSRKVERRSSPTRTCGILRA